MNMIAPGIALRPLFAVTGTRRSTISAENSPIPTRMSTIPSSKPLGSNPFRPVVPLRSKRMNLRTSSVTGLANTMDLSIPPGTATSSRACAMTGEAPEETWTTGIGINLQFAAAGITIIPGPNERQPDPVTAYGSGDGLVAVAFGSH